MARNSNTNYIKYQESAIANNNDLDEEEQAKKLLAQDDEQWDDGDFDDDDDDFDDNDDDGFEDQGDDDGSWEDDDDNDQEMNSFGDNVNYDEKDEFDDDDDDDGWGKAKPTDNIGMIDMKLPEKMLPFEVLKPRQLLEYQINFMKDISEQLDIADLDAVGIICRYFRWNKNQLMDEYFFNQEKVLKDCGIKSSSPSLTKPQTKGKFDCWLCIQEYTDCAQDTYYPQECGHQYCNQCWTNYLISQMEKGPRKVVMTKCIDPKCKLTLRPMVFQKFLPYKHCKKFEEYLSHSFVSGLNNLSWCPGKDCSNAVKADYGTPITIDCPDCHHLWCFACKNEAHLPCNCELADKWMKLHSTDSENVTWVRAFTKQCPKCKNHIEKNNGCNHMTCRCGYEFCWLCRKDWKKIGYGHQCNKPQDVIDEENEQKNAQSYLKRYMFYFSRYEAHEKSAQIAMKSIQNAKECIRSFIINKGRYDTIKQYKYSDVQFIEDAITEIISCRHILQWSYCFGYYLQDGCKLKVLFESQQGLLESFSDQLHEKAEKKVDDRNQWFTLSDLKVREQLINLTKTAKRYRENFCDALLSEELPFKFQNGIK